MLSSMSKPWLPSTRITRLASLLILVLAFVNFLFLIRAWQSGAWIFNQDGQIIPADFVSFWSTGRMLKTVSAADIYDWSLHHIAEVEVLGPGHTARLPWLNPPIFLLAVAPLAMMPYMAAFLSWIGVTFLAYAAMLRAVLPAMPLWGAMAGALAFPAVLWTIFVGQNGLLTGALVGGTLALLDRHPLVAGFLLGLLTYKPQFGILFPIILLVTARWKVFASASATTLALSALAALLFGTEVWEAFWNSLSQTQEAILTEGKMGLYKLQSFYGAVLWLTGNLEMAWSAQALATLLVLAGLIWVWRGPTSMEVRSAAMGLAVLLATPYVLIYDLPVLAIPLAFLLRAGLQRGFPSFEPFLMLLVCTVVFAFPFFKAPLGLVACCLVAVMILSRVWSERAKAQHRASLQAIS
ncbi:glycosyltransferase family 87 protein [Microvirga sp. CF3062]|uniref:glycosyltransferase family 87 protein n=1 Tax=Microvirga sp. CF3062 TaxID=3110182 RepID=UPI002E76C6E0|nr:glycosyltransferase family 87 protein [Microvirga sp. CF3062]MEE1656966.1 glycosyltransferase family 87 protein [Microvirga sp. CF3062]